MEGTGLSSIVTSGMLNGVLDEVVGLIPVVIPVAIGFLAIRKGIAFLFGVLRSC